MPPRTPVYRDSKQLIARCLRTIWIELRRGRTDAAHAAIDRFSEEMLEELTADDHLSDFGVPTRNVEALEKYCGASTLREASELTPRQLRKIPYFGANCIKSLHETIRRHKHLLQPTRQPDPLVEREAEGEDEGEGEGGRGGLCRGPKPRRKT